MEEQTQKHPEDEQRWKTATTVSFKVFCRFFVSSLMEAFYKPVPAGLLAHDPSMTVRACVLATEKAPLGLCDCRFPTLYFC